MNVLVTGATGFIGSHAVVRLLERGHRVTAVARNAERAAASPWHGRAEFIAADIHEPSTLEQLRPAEFDAVLHLAWPGLPNYKALVHLEETLPAECAFLKGLVTSGTGQVLVSGTCFEYGLRNGCLDETVPPEPVTPYGIAKNTLRCYLEALQSIHPFRLQWARLFYMFGPGQNPKSLLSQLDAAIDRGDAVFAMSGGEQLRDYLAVERVAAHLVALLEYPGFEGIVNVCSGTPVSVRRLVEERIAERGVSMKLKLGHYPYPDYEPMSFWGDAGKLRRLSAETAQPLNTPGRKKTAMKAQIKPRINQEGRTRLEEVIPLATPFVLFVDPSSACNFRCKFCPSGDAGLIRESGRWQGAMDLGLYRKLIDDLKEFDEPLKVLRLYKDGEPLLNRHFADMVRIAKESGVARSVDTTTNGSLLDPERMKPVLDAGIDRINISVDGLSDDQFLEFTGVRVHFDTFVDNIRKLYEMKGQCEILVKIAGDFLSEKDKERFFSIFGDCADRIFIENVAPCWPEFDVADRLNVSLDRGIYDQPIGEVTTCPYIFYSLSVNSDGSVSLCFLDWARKLIVGDMRQESLKEIWNGERLLRHRMAHLEGRRKQDPVCGACGQLTHCLPDNIDPYAAVLLDRITGSLPAL